MKKIVNRLFGALLAVLLLVALVPSGSAEAEQQTIRVAFPTQEGMSFIGHSGKVGGYNYDYLEKYPSIPAGRWNMCPMAVPTATRPSAAP